MIFNEDLGRHGQEISQRVGASNQFSELRFVDRAEAFTKALDQQRIMVAIHIPQDFSRRIDDRSGASLQLIYDGRKSNATQITNGYL